MYKALRHGTGEVAVKHIPCIVDDPQKLQQLRREIAIMQCISYDKHVVQFYGACTMRDGAWLCMEYMEVGSSACVTQLSCFSHDGRLGPIRPISFLSDGHYSRPKAFLDADHCWARVGA